MGCFAESLAGEVEDILRRLVASGDVVTIRAGDMYDLTGHWKSATTGLVLRFSSREQ